MKKLIINADDFGYRSEINKGIIFAHQNGLVTSASLFVEKEGTEDALKLINANPGLGVGIHLDLDRFFEVDHQMGVIVGWAASFKNIEELRNEVFRQIEKYLSFGLELDHIDSHHHAHLFEDVFHVICDAAKKYNIPAARFAEKYFSDPSQIELAKQCARENGINAADHFIEGWYWGNIDEDYQVAELMTHPGYGELWREAELAHCCQPQLKQYFMDSKIELLRFSDAFSSER